MYCMYYMYLIVLVCIQYIACMVIVLHVHSHMNLRVFVLACIDLYCVSIDSIILFCLPIHANTWQYIPIRTVSKYWVENTLSIHS